MMAGNLPGKQRGVILLVLFMILFVVGSSVFLSAVDYRSVTLKRESEVRYQLEQAKEALLAYAFSYPDFAANGPGRLPCPDIDDDGEEDTDSGDCTDNVRGRLPEYINLSGSRFNLSDYHADSDQQFWYVVSPAFLEITSSSLNSTDTGTFTVDGKSGYVAVIIAPGEALSSQNRASDPTAVSNYLEADNVSGTSFINYYSSDPDNFNDQVLGITWTELMTLATMKVATVMQSVLDVYYEEEYSSPKRYPHSIDYYANPTFSDYMHDNAPFWYEDGSGDNWLNVTDYTRVSYDWNHATVKFDDCGITYSMTYGAGITRDRSTC